MTYLTVNVLDDVEALELALHGKADVDMHVVFENWEDGTWQKVHVVRWAVKAWDDVWAYCADGDGYPIFALQPVNGYTPPNLLRRV